MKLKLPIWIEMLNVDFTSLYREREREREIYIYLFLYFDFHFNIINTTTDYQLVKSKISTQNQH
jgi:hypothetical protein